MNTTTVDRLIKALNRAAKMVNSPYKETRQIGRQAIFSAVRLLKQHQENTP